MRMDSPMTSAVLLPCYTRRYHQHDRHHSMCVLMPSILQHVNSTALREERKKEAEQCHSSTIGTLRARRRFVSHSGNTGDIFLVDYYTNTTTIASMLSYILKSLLQNRSFSTFTRRMNWAKIQQLITMGKE